MSARSNILMIAIALFLATGAAADEPFTGWDWDWHRCDLVKYRKGEIVRESRIEVEDIAELEKLLPLMRKCDRFYQCVIKRDYPKGWVEGAPSPLKPGEKKPKHCFWPRELAGC